MCIIWGPEWAGRWRGYGQSALDGANYKQFGHELKHDSCHLSLLFSSTDVAKDPFASWASSFIVYSFVFFFFL